MQSRIVKIGFPTGLHARAAAAVADLAKSFRCSILAAKDGQRVDATSVLSLLLLEAGPGAELEIVAEGADELAAVEALASFIEAGMLPQSKTD